jgi:hypothetical protein
MGKTLEQLGAFPYTPATTDLVYLARPGNGGDGYVTLAQAALNLFEYKGSYDASTNTPDLDAAPVGVLVGDTYKVSVAGTFFTELLEPGDVITAIINNPSTLAHWTVVQSNLTAAIIKSQYESNADTNAFTDADETKLDSLINSFSNNLWEYRAKTSAQAGYPANGYILWNNADQVSATSILVSHLTYDDFDVERMLGLILQGQEMIIQDKDESANFQIWLVSGTPIVTNADTSTAYYTYPVTLQSSGGTGTTGLPNNSQIILGLTQAVAIHTHTNAQSADMETKTIKGRATAGTGAPEDLTVAQVRTMLGESTRAINITAGMTTAQIQAEIDAIGKYIPYGVTVYLRFADGTYTATATLDILGFYGEGTLSIDGNITETTALHTNQAVHINGTSYAGSIININTCSAKVQVRFMKLTAQDGYKSINISSAGIVAVQYNYLILTGKTSTNSRHVMIAGAKCQCTLTNNYINNGYYGITVQGSSFVTSDNTVVTGTSPSIGLACITFGKIYKLNTQPTSTAASESTSLGGQIV